MPPECRPIRRYLRRRQREGVQVPCCRQQSSQSVCTVSCNRGFIGDSVTYLCNISTTDDCVPVDGQEIMCERGLYLMLHVYNYCIFFVMTILLTDY